MATPLERSEAARDRNAMVRWTRRVVAHRRAILAAWSVLFILGGWAASDLGRLLTNRFSVPGSDAEQGVTILRSRFHERGDGGAFTLVVRSNGPTVAPAQAEAAAQPPRMNSTPQAARMARRWATTRRVQRTSALRSRAASERSSGVAIASS